MDKRLNGSLPREQFLNDVVIQLDVLGTIPEDWFFNPKTVVGVPHHSGTLLTGTCTYLQ